MGHRTRPEKAGVLFASTERLPLDGRTSVLYNADVSYRDLSWRGRDGETSRRAVRTCQVWELGRSSANSGDVARRLHRNLAVRSTGLWRLPMFCASSARPMHDSDVKQDPPASGLFRFASFLETMCSHRCPSAVRPLPFTTSCTSGVSEPSPGDGFEPHLNPAREAVRPWFPRHVRLQSAPAGSPGHPSALRQLAVRPPRIHVPMSLHPHYPCRSCHRVNRAAALEGDTLVC
jgi:hypothetical protein